MYAKPNYLMIKPDSVADRMAQAARRFAKGKNVLFHGTRYSVEILRTGVLRYGRAGDNSIFFSRDARVSAYWARVPRDGRAGRGAIFVFDREKLRQRYLVETDRYWGWDADEALWEDEMEEKIWGLDIYHPQRFLLGIVWEGPDPGKPLGKYNCPHVFVAADTSQGK